MHKSVKGMSAAAAVVAVALAFSIAGLLAQENKESNLTNQTIANNIARALRSVDLKGSTVDIEVRHGVATLEGTIATLEAKKQVTNAAARIEGVYSVVNRLELAAGEIDLAEQFSSEIGDALGVFFKAPNVIGNPAEDGCIVLTSWSSVAKNSLIVVDVTADEITLNGRVESDEQIEQVVKAVRKVVNAFDKVQEGQEPKRKVSSRLRALPAPREGAATAAKAKSSDVETK